MSYEKFKEKLMQAVQSQVEPEKEVCFVMRAKYNESKREGITYRTPKAGAVPTVYLDELYTLHMKGKLIEDLARDVVEIFQTEEVIPDKFIFPEWEEVKSKIEIRLLKKEWNTRYLENHPYKEYLDFAVTFVVLFWKSTGSMLSMDVSNSFMEEWGINTEDLWNAGIQNLTKKTMAVLDADLISGVDCFEGESPMYVVFLKESLYGASVLLREDLIGKIAEEKNTDIYILPSSAKEVLFMKKTEDSDEKVMKETIQYVNNESGVMEAGECLSDSLYLYSREEGKIRIVS